MALDSALAPWLDRVVNVRSIAVTLLACWGAATALADAQDWTLVDKERGITVSKREQPGSDIPSFRGQGVVEGNVLKILALMLDTSTTSRWAIPVDEARVLGRIDEHTDRVYLYSDIPWPVRDRDMVVRRDVEVVQAGTEYRMRLRCEQGAVPERSGVVRVSKCDSVFRLRKVDPSHTEIDYVMTLDPAGNLPGWVGSWVAENVPLKTLVALEREAAATTHQYEAVLRRWSVAM
jgi:hypothetical protein